MPATPTTSPRRRFPSASATVAALALLAVLGTPSCAPRAAAPAPAALTVMTYNIHYGDPDLGRMARVICDAGADVVGLQEVDVHWAERSAFAHQAEELARACGMEYRYGPIYDLPPLEDGKPNRRFGVAVLTRLPVLGWKNHPLTRLSTQADASPGPLPGFLQVTVDHGGTPVDVFVTHLDFRPDPAVRRIQVAEMLAVIGALDRPVVLLGDMNAGPDRPELAPLFEALRDAWSAGSGPGYTFPGHAPDRRIDYVLVGGPLTVRAARVLETDASDHRPVVAELLPDRP